MPSSKPTIYVVEFEENGVWEAFNEESFIEEEEANERRELFQEENPGRNFRVAAYERREG